MSALEVVMMKRIGELKAEIEALKAENERLRASSFVTAVPSEEYEKLKAEVERLRCLSDELNNTTEYLELENARLRKFNDEALAHIAKEERKSRERLDIVQADVERLIKAGDAVCESPYLLETDPAVIAWRAAKEDFSR